MPEIIKLNHNYEETKSLLRKLGFRFEPMNHIHDDIVLEHTGWFYIEADDSVPGKDYSAAFMMDMGRLLQLVNEDIGNFPIYHDKIRQALKEASVTT